MARISADQRRQDLTEAAFRVMAEVGVSATTTRLVAEEAGVPQSLFHYCFRSKGELFQQLTRHVVDSMLGDALDSLVDGGTFEQSVHRSIRELWTSAVSHPERQLVLYELTAASLRELGGEDLARWQYEQYFDHGRQLLTALAARGGMEWTAPLDVLGRMMTSMIDGTVLGWLTDRDSEEAEASLELFAAVLVSYATPRSAVPRAGSDVRDDGQRDGARCIPQP